MDKSLQIGRIAFRHEGSMWNAYWADSDNMKDAILMGSILMTIVTLNPELKLKFMEAMRSAVDTILKEGLGIKSEWAGPQKAPEHERAGEA